MKKYLVSMAAMLLLSTGAQAATYLLSSVTYFNTFGGSSPVASCTGCGMATAVTGGNPGDAVALTGVSWVFSGGGNAYTISFDANTTLASGTTLSKLPGATCVQTLGAVCTPTNVRSGLGNGTFYTGIASDNLTTCTNDRCRIDVSVSGSNLLVVIKRALSESATSSAYQSYTMSFAQVPVPAAVWLFGSALGLMGFARRKAA